VEEDLQRILVQEIREVLEAVVVVLVIMLEEQETLHR
jgi:hypothetical protein